MNSLSGQSALVTGGAKRIGLAIALALAGAGADVTITYRTSADDAVETVDAIEQLGRRGFALECDVRSEASVRSAVAASVGEHGRLDLLINNAAIFETAALDTLSIEHWDAVFETNTRGPFLMAREALPHLRATRGRIINIGSLGGLRAWASHAHYCASKAGVHMLTRAMAKAFAPEVSVNCIAPGAIEMEESIELESQQGSEAAPDPARIAAFQTEARARAARLAAKTPIGRNGSAEEVAQAVLFFATTTNFITGQILAVDGGLGL